MTLSKQNCWKSRIRVWSPLIGRRGGSGWGKMENTETAYFLVNGFFSATEWNFIKLTKRTKFYIGGGCRYTPLTTHHVCCTWKIICYLLPVLARRCEQTIFGYEKYIWFPNARREPRSDCHIRWSNCVAVVSPRGKIPNWASSATTRSICWECQCKSEVRHNPKEYKNHLKTKRKKLPGRNKQNCQKNRPHKKKPAANIYYH